MSAAASIPAHSRVLLDEFGRTYQNLRTGRFNLNERFRATFPVMSRLLDLAHVSTFSVSYQHSRRTITERHRLIAWRTSRGGQCGWICKVGRANPVPREVNAEHRLVNRTIGTIEMFLGEPPRLPMGCAELFFVPRFTGLGASKTSYYLDTLRGLHADVVPDPDEFVIFGAEATGDLWVYTAQDRRVFQIVFGGGPIDTVDLRQVKATPQLYTVKGGKTFRDFVEYFAARHLRVVDETLASRVRTRPS